MNAEKSEVPKLARAESRNVKQLSTVVTDLFNEAYMNTNNRNSTIWYRLTRVLSVVTTPAEKQTMPLYPCRVSWCGALLVVS